MREVVHVVLWSGDAEQARARLSGHFPGADFDIIPVRALREAASRDRLRTLWSLRGKALVFFFADLSRSPRRELLLWTGLVHRCELTAVADSRGDFECRSRSNWLIGLASAVLSLLPDIASVATCSLAVMAWPILRATLRLGRRTRPADPTYDVAYLYPFPLQHAEPGGEMTYLCGTLDGFARAGIDVKVFSGCELPVNACAVDVVPSPRRRWMLREAVEIAYNVTFARAVLNSFRQHRPRIMYQRHGRFLICGAVLSWITSIPLIIEYQSSEQWRAANWDPSFFPRLLARCERLSLSAGDGFVALSRPLLAELVALGIRSEKVVINPAAVDPERFRPGCGGRTLRRQLDIADSEVLVVFVGSFSYWHGIPFLAQAIKLMIADGRQRTGQLRFVLVGAGILHPEIRAVLADAEAQGIVRFTGTIEHEAIPSYLDAADILVSPHVPSDSGGFFGSPTKLFEYMAAGRAIVASDLDQLSDVLCDRINAMLVPPKDAESLAQSIYELAIDAGLRAFLGRNARRTALERHTWDRNAARLAERFLEQSCRAELNTAVEN